ncbi:MAG: DUF1684 domain-containing protein [Thermoflexibacteraceae bacterium]|jgi:uncharacterized protein (DUF1684 family)
MIKFKYSLLAGLAVGFAFIFFYTFKDSKPENDNSYVRQIRKEREKKDKDFKYAEWSPLTAEQRKTFTKLDYFEPNLQYKVMAKIALLENDTVFKIMTSSNEIRRFYKYAHLQFRLDSKDCQLLLFKSAEPTSPNYYFLPFKDLTTGVSTYGTGRYIDIETPKTNSIEIDFNRAYNPYCAYNEEYSCPLPPTENTLNVSVLAGERLFKNKVGE